MMNTFLKIAVVFMVAIVSALACHYVFNEREDALGWIFSLTVLLPAGCIGRAMQGPLFHWGSESAAMCAVISTNIGIVFGVGMLMKLFKKSKKDQ